MAVDRIFILLRPHIGKLDRITMGNEAMNRLDWLGAQATEPGDGGLWHKWHVPDLVRAARALEGYQCYGKERCKEIKLKDGT